MFGISCYESAYFAFSVQKYKKIFAFRSLIRTFATKVAKLHHLGKKKKRVSFVLRSIFCNFAR